MKNKIERVTRIDSKNARLEFDELIKNIRQDLKLKYKFVIRLNGSARYNCIVRDTNGQFDLDYRMILTKNCKSNAYINNKTTEIRNDIFKSFQKFSSQFNFKMEESSSVITIIKMANNKRIYSYDVCIVKEYKQLSLENNFNNDYQYLKRNSNGKDGGNSYTWCTLKRSNEAYYKWNNLSHKDKEYLILNVILPKKIEMKKIHQNSKNWKTSEQLFIESINNNF